MRNQFQLFLIFAASWTSTIPFQWSTEPADNDVQRVCQGDDLHLLWDFNSTGNSIVTSIQWFFKGSSEEVVAMKSHGHFLPMATYYDRVRFVPGAGLVISHVVLADKGNYSVEILGTGDSFATGKQRRSVTVEIAAEQPPKSDNDDLLVREDDAAWFDNSTGQWAVRLTCGHLVNLGQPPVDVVWTTPSGQTVNSSSQENGDFHLLLYSPVQGGNYMCSLRPQSPATSCLSNTSGLAQTSAYHVSQMQAQHKVMQYNEITQQLQECRENKVYIAQLRQEWRQKEENMSNYILQLEGELAISLTKNAKPTSCVDSRSSNPVSGVVTIYPDNVTAVEVFCDQDTNGGGWAVFQRRQDGSVDFYRNWTDYQNQFGDLNGEFWIGLDALHTLTSSQPQELRVDLTMWNGTRVSASYSGFTVSDGGDNYRLNYTSFLGGTAGDSLSRQRGQQFSTKDADHDTRSDHCAQEYRGAWWYKSCHDSNLNALYKTNSSAPRQDGLNWRTATKESTHYSMKATEMKLRPS